MTYVLERFGRILAADVKEDFFAATKISMPTTLARKHETFSVVTTGTEP